MFGHFANICRTNNNQAEIKQNAIWKLTLFGERKSDRGGQEILEVLS